MKPALGRVFAGLPLLLPFLSLFFVISGAIGLVFIQQPLGETQEIRSDASVEAGSTEIVSLTSTSSDLKTLNQETTISLGFNTHNTSIRSLTAVFNIITETTNQVELVVPAMSGIEASVTELESTSDGFLAEVRLEPTGSYFSTNYNQPFLEIRFVPSETGTIELNFDREESTAPKASNGEDTLKHVAVFKYTIAQQDSSSTVKSCNEKCTSNAECASGFRCYNLGTESRCRLVDNPSSSSCLTTDQASKSSCNQRCEADRDCQTGLSCYTNLCRNPKNLTSTSCANPATTTASTADTQSCNEACSSHSDCDVNYSCYNGSCRLAVNPSSSTCSATTTTTISDRYDKGSTETQTATSAAVTKPATATDSADATVSAQTSPTPLPSPTAEPVAPEPEETAWDTLRNILNQPEAQLPLIVIGAGIGLAVLGSLAYALLKKTGVRTVSTTRTSPPPAPATPPAPSMPRPAALPPTPPTQADAAASKTNNSMVDRLKQKGISTGPKAAHSDIKNQ